MKPEVVVREVRRRRRSTPPPDTPPPLNVRNWMIYLLVVLGLATLMLNGALTDRPATVPLPALSQARDVRSTIWAEADSLQVEVGWDLTMSEPGGMPDSVRVRVIPSSGDTLTLTQLGAALADTARLAAPKPGQTASGLSCVAAQHDRDSLIEEVCTPWQYVRPLAAAKSDAKPAATQIVVQPSGLQVDPDIDGKCAEWQRTHQNDSVWIEVNLTAVPECTGPNDKPIVAQFCAFMIMPDGRRLKTANSANNRYCDELFTEWIRERYS